MESKDELKEIDINNHACYYFDDIMRAIDINSSDIILNKNIYEKVNLWHFIENCYGFEIFRIWFDIIDGFIKIYGGIRYLVLLNCSWFDEICDKYLYK